MILLTASVEQFIQCVWNKITFDLDI